MSAVSAAVSAPARAPRAWSRRSARAGRPAAAGMVRRRLAGAAETAPDSAASWLVPALLALGALAAFAVLCLPALRVELAVGWLPLWLLAAPLSAAGALGLVRRFSDRRPALRR